MAEAGGGGAAVRSRGSVSRWRGNERGGERGGENGGLGYKKRSGG